MKSSPTYIYFEVTEQKPRLGGSGPTVRILGMIDRLEPKVNLSLITFLKSLFNHENEKPLFPREKLFANYGLEIKVNL